MSKYLELCIDSVAVPGGRGLIGMCACPGGRRTSASGWDPEGDLEGDLDALRDWGAQSLVSLIEDQEFQLLGATRLPQCSRRRGLRWWHLPIRDMCAPNDAFETHWRHVGEELRRLLADDGRVALHCWAGLGRTGTIAARLLVELGDDPQRAMERVREARPGAIQTRQQEVYIKRLRSLAKRQ